MRSSGVAGSVRGLGPHDHVCWDYDDPAEFRDRALEFVAEGIEQGSRVVCVAGGRTEDLLALLEPLPGAEELLARDALRVLSIDEQYVPEMVVDPRAQVRTYAAATEEALRDGFAGLRVAAEATPLVRTAAQREMFARYECLVDEYMARHPFSALCAYRRDVLGSDAVAEIASMHPVVREGATPFHVFRDATGVLAIGGELDVTCRALFERALATVPVPADRGELVVDLSAVDFVDHRSLMMLDEWACGRATALVLRCAPPVVRHVVDVLALDRISVEVAA